MVNKLAVSNSSILPFPTNNQQEKLNPQEKSFQAPPLPGGAVLERTISVGSGTSSMSRKVFRTSAFQIYVGVTYGSDRDNGNNMETTMCSWLLVSFELELECRIFNTKAVNT